jgi:uncharacterized damage-inducible protein DinB
MAFFPAIGAIRNGWGWPEEDVFADSIRKPVSSLYRMRLNVLLAVRDLNEEQLWYRLGPDVSAIGNLLMHLRGSEHQWIGNKIGGIPLQRDRDHEFAARRGKDLGELIRDIEDTERQTRSTLSALSTETILAFRSDQGYSIEFILHYMIQHFSLHLGQIIAVREYLAPGYRLYPG